MPQVFVVDDDALVRRSISRVLISAGHDVRAFGSAKEFLEHARADEPTCVVLDLRLPDVGGMEVQRALREKGAVVQVIFMSGFGDIPITVEAMKSGAFDFLTKPVTDARLLATIDAALAEASKRFDEVQQRRTILSHYESLTPREKEVLQLVVSGRLNKQIARELRISEKTVKAHRGHVMRKMGTRRVAQLVQLALRLGIKAAQPAERAEPDRRAEA